MAPEELLSFLDRIAAWDASAWFAHREKYVATYGPLPFLPPDNPNAVVLQATLGHAGGIAFGLGRVAEHEVRSACAFEEHARAVEALLGRRAEQARSLFLAGGDVLRQPADQVESYLETAAHVFRVRSTPDARLGGIDAFLDDLNPGLPDRAAWSRFRERHLRRVSLGVESGDEVVRSRYGKTWRNEALRAVVADLKEAGLGVNLLVLVDAGGVESADRHVEATAALVNTLPLGAGDLVALLDGNEVRDPDRSLPGFTPLTARGGPISSLASAKRWRPSGPARGEGRALQFRKAEWLIAVIHVFKNSKSQTCNEASRRWRLDSRSRAP